MQINDIKAEKSRLRAHFRKLRNSLTEADREKSDAIIFERLASLPEYKSAKQIFAYASMGSEVDTSRIINRALDDNKAVALPKCKADNELDFYYIASADDLENGAYGISEPKYGLTKAEDLSGLCIVPALLFDRRGFRLGYGKGYYDRFLTRFNGITVGVCRDEFIADRLPRYNTDCRVDMIITDKAVYTTD